MSREFKEGDWGCPSCGDHQFARNSACRRCGTAKPSGTVAAAATWHEDPKGFKEGDWNCASCGDHQFARNTSCRRCGSARSGASPAAPVRVSGGVAAARVAAAVEEPKSVVEDFKDGDWLCSSCGDHQFARNIICRKCGHPKSTVEEEEEEEEVPAAPVQPSTPVTPTEFKEGDWKCPSCGDHQFARNVACRKCARPRPKSVKPPAPATPVPQEVTVAAEDFKEGDWHCPGCGDHQFARNSTCRRCGTQKPVISSNNQVSKVGDWICPNPVCGDLQFERNEACRRCGTPKNLLAAAAAVLSRKGMPAAILAKAFNGSVGKGVAVPVPVVPTPRPTSNQGVKSGDWNCPTCGDHQFERNTSCRRCATPKPVYTARPVPTVAYNPFLAMPTPVMVARALPAAVASMAAAGGDFKPGDWNCPNCGDHQFGRNETCRRCSTSRPAVSSNHQTMRAGDWICPNKECRDVQFAKNDQCRKCGTVKPDESSGAARRRSRSRRR